MRTLPRKIKEQIRLRPAKSQSICSLPREMPATLFFAPQNYWAMQTLPREIMETRFQGPENIIKFDFLFSKYFCDGILEVLTAF